MVFRQKWREPLGAETLAGKAGTYLRPRVEYADHPQGRHKRDMSPGPAANDMKVLS